MKLEIRLSRTGPLVFTLQFLGNGCLDWTRQHRHTVCMKRTNLVLDEVVLAEATRLGGQKTYSATVNAALYDFVRRARAHEILSLRGSGAWQGTLSHMRGDLAKSARPVRRGARP